MITLSNSKSVTKNERFKRLIGLTQLADHYVNGVSIQETVQNAFLLKTSDV